MNTTMTPYTHQTLLGFVRRPVALAVVLPAALWLGGCASSFNSPYQAPALQLPSQYSQAAAETSPAATPATSVVRLWWTRFNDPVLDQLVADVLARNNNLAAAAIRVRRAQLQAGLADQALQPALSGSASVGTRRALEAGANLTRSSGASLSASYEIDLWNKLGSQREVARWEALATEQDRQSARLALVGTTARLYWQLAFINQRLASSAESIGYAQTTFKLVQTQYRAGAASGLEVAEAQQALASQQASQSALRQQAVEARTALALLLDSAPGASGKPPVNPVSLPTAALPTLDAGLPASLLARRPDLRAAELRLRESFTRIDATRASYYPALSLTGSLGTSSAQLGNLLQNPVAALGLGVTLPFLQRANMQLSIQVSETQYEEAVVNFRQTLYTALGDVDNALSSRQQLAQQAVLLEESLQAARTAERLYEARYRAGAAALKAWLDAQEKRRSADIALADNRLARLNSQAALYQALGGDTEPASTPRSQP
jgi:NodT family efflux transporter outer membrane factor (OMF) lipoprotein